MIFDKFIHTNMGIFEEAILKKIGARIDTSEVEKEIEELEKQHRQLTGAKNRLGQQMDSLDITDRFYEKKYQDMETRLYRLYDEIEGVENSISEVKNQLLNIKQKKISEDNVYQFLLYFDKLYDKFTDLEKIVGTMKVPLKRFVYSLRNIAGIYKNMSVKSLINMDKDEYENYIEHAINVIKWRTEKLEDRLGDILVALYEKAEENRIVREAREEAERKRVEEARRREENRQRKEQEIRLVKELVNKADWYDPSIATEDEYLGKRQHEKSAEEKEKSLQDSIRKSWYW